MPGHVAEHARSYRGRVAERMRALARLVIALLPSPPVTIQFLYRDSSPLLRAPLAVSSPHSAVSQHRVARARCRIAKLKHCITTQSRPPQSRYKFFYHDPLLAGHARAHAAARPARRPALSWPHLTVSQACSAVSWPCPSWPCTPLRACVLLYHDTVCCIVTKPGN